MAARDERNMMESTCVEPPMCNTCISVGVDTVHTDTLRYCAHVDHVDRHHFDARDPP